MQKQGLEARMRLRCTLSYSRTQERYRRGLLSKQLRQHDKEVQLLLRLNNRPCLQRQESDLWQQES